MELKHELIKKELFCMYKKTTKKTNNLKHMKHIHDSTHRSHTGAQEEKKNLYKGHGADAFIYFIIIFNKVPFLFVFLTLKYVQHKTRQA